MAENERNRGVPGTDRVPVTPAPGRSRTNLANRASDAERLLAAIRGIPPPAAKPPPDVSVVHEPRRSGEAASVVVKHRAPSAQVNPVFCEAVPLAERRRNPWKTAAKCLIALLCVLTGMVIGNSVDRAVVPPHRDTAPPGGRDISHTEPARVLQDDAGAAFTTALDDLDNAVVDRPQQSAEEILKMVSRPGYDCMLVWNGDYPSLVFGMRPIPPNSLTTTLEGCAQAVKQLPR
jgi:hypothetical protein